MLTEKVSISLDLSPCFDRLRQSLEAGAHCIRNQPIK
nr:MAG TPA: hypothetical protein [Caudoviricetes sp.]